NSCGIINGCYVIFWNKDKLGLCFLVTTQPTSTIAASYAKRRNAHVLIVHSACLVLAIPCSDSLFW
ncbi:MAG TPA: hypothetical protein VKR58_07490, partial [Aquella sp.]|nr:hypothetical protein [Aquella sp.]